MKKLLIVAAVAVALYFAVDAIRHLLDDPGDPEVTYIAIPGGSHVVKATEKVAAIVDFQMARTPTTVAQYRSCVEAGDCVPSEYLKSKGCNFKELGHANHPVNCVTAEEALAFCQWQGGRLPTEAEWEWAATHDGTVRRDTKYPWGDDPDYNKIGPYGQGTMEVGGRSPQGDSPLGLTDMAGNVWEWTSDVGVAEGTRVIKGGGWQSSMEHQLVTHRAADVPALYYSNMIGFRCVK